MLSRDQKKRQTRKSLMDAALMLVGSGRNYSSISLREVAKHAGVVPTSFYRHFPDMEELGLNLVDDTGLLLRKLMRKTRQTEGMVARTVLSSIEVFTDFVCQHRSYFHFMCQCRTGGSITLRNAVRNELRFFANELVMDIRQSATLPEVDQSDLEVVAQLIVDTVAETTIDILDLAETSASVKQEFIKKTEMKLRLILLGAGCWQSPSSNR